MKNTIKALLFCCLPLAQAIAQDDAGKPSPTPTASGLEISNTRTQAERIDFLLEVANAYIAEKDYVSAVGVYERILEIDPTHPQTRYMVAHIYINAKEYEKAEKMLKSLLEENPTDYKLLNNLAWLYATAENPKIRNGKKAVRYAQEAMVLAPNDYHVWSTLSEAYYVSGNYEKAYRAIEQMASLAALYGKDLTEESIQEYNEQIRKCKRSMDTAKILKSEEEDAEQAP